MYRHTSQPSDTARTAMRGQHTWSGSRLPYLRRLACGQNVVRVACPPASAIYRRLAQPQERGLKASLTNADRHRLHGSGALLHPCCLLPHRGRLTDSMARVHHGQALRIAPTRLSAQTHHACFLMERKSEEGKGKEDKKDKGH